MALAGSCLECGQRTSGSITMQKDKDEGEWLVGSGVTRGSVLRFDCAALASPLGNPPARRLRMTFKVVQAESELLAMVLNAHGFLEVGEDVPDFNLIWAGIPPKMEVFTTLVAHQKINHFPRSLELTRKDRLACNLTKCRFSKLAKHFDFMPETFLLPAEYAKFCSEHKRSRCSWIIKPIASSRGRGISIVTSLADVPTDENVVVAQYIDNPLLIGGLKSDLRLYVAVTSYNPLVIYLYEEGLVRFATVKYIPGGQQLWNLCMHLCNYSLNKYHADYVTNDDANAENVGHKWTMSALLKYLRSRGCDTTALMQRVEKLIVKTVMVVAPVVGSAIEIFVPYKRNCFEVYGFDILIDANLKPWLLEVNYSPSLICDSPLDMRVKSAMLVDLLTLVGLPAVAPVRRQTTKVQTPRVGVLKTNRLPFAGVARGVGADKSASGSNSLTHEQAGIVKALRAEFDRRGGFVRIFPTPDSWHRYGSILDPTTGLIASESSMSRENVHTSIASQNYNLAIHKALFPEVNRNSQEVESAQCHLAKRVQRYERILVTGHKVMIDQRLTHEPEQTSVRLANSTLLMIDCLHSGYQLNQWQVRHVFAEFLSMILRRVTGMSNLPDDKRQAEQLLVFLQKISTNFRCRYTIQLPSHLLSGKDREAVVSKRLHDFVSEYSHETDLHAIKDDRRQFVSREVFQEFLSGAGERDLEVVLSTSTQLHGSGHLYPGRCGLNTKPLSYPQTLHTFSSILKKRKSSKK